MLAAHAVAAHLLPFKFLIMKNLTIIILLFVAITNCILPKKTIAQHNEKQTLSGLNNVDHNNKKQGTWYIKTEALRGEPETITFGNYVDNKKEGLWYMLDNNKSLIAIEQYRNDVLDGTSQYFNNGKLVCVGNWRGLNPNNKYDSFWVTDPITLKDTLIVALSEQGTLKHGFWRYYDERSGQLIREEEYQLGRVIYRQTFKVQYVTDSIYIEEMKKKQAINQKKTSKPPPGKGRKI